MSCITSQIRDLLVFDFDDTFNHKEMSKSRKKKDNSDMKALEDITKKFNIISFDTETDVLQNAANKDVATEAIQVSLLNACELGHVQTENFVNDCMISSDDV